MYLRELKRKDAEPMLAWMHDRDVMRDLHADFSKKTAADAEAFIENAARSGNDLHLAVCAEDDTYMGTVSLKGIDRARGEAEFAITVRKEAMGHGYAWFAMRAILQKAFDELHLRRVYWCVAEKNARAVRFYDSHRFARAADLPQEILRRYDGVEGLRWYCVERGEAFGKPQTVAGCKVISLRTVETEGAGKLSFFEGEHDLPFPIRRIYYITGVREGVRRGFHAHKTLRQLLFCPYGRIELLIERDGKREKIELSDPSTGVVIDGFAWREMLWLQDNSVLCVAASDYYDEGDYVRDYDEFRRLASEAAKKTEGESV